MRLPNLPAVARNLTRLVLHRSRRSLRGVGKIARAAAKRSLRRAEIVSRTPAVVSGWRDSARTRLTRWHSDVERLNDHAVRPYLQSRRVKQALRQVSRGSAPIVVGPWISEVGYEALYWVPFLRWFADRYRIPRERLIAVSRGGVESWYRDVAAQYVDLLKIIGVDEFARESAERRSSGDQKQFRPSPWEDALIARVTRHLGATDVTVLHPGLMYQLFRAFWHGDRSLEYLFRHTRYRAVSPPRDMELPPLPQTYAAVKFYSGPALPATPAVRQRLRGLIASIAEKYPIVTLDTGLALDEHEDYLFRDVPGVVSLRSWLTPDANLEQQTAVIARARLFVGTCGSLAWLAPMLGVDTLAVYEDDRYLSAHLYAARHVYRNMGAARFSVLDLNAVDGVRALGPHGLAIDANAVAGGSRRLGR